MQPGPFEAVPLTSADLTVERMAARGDRIGMFGSLLCAVHCALLPLVIAVVPTLGFGVMSWVDVDQAFTVFATLLGLTTLGFGFRRHRRFGGWLLLLPGLALVWIGSFSPLHTHSGGHAVVMVVGGLAIAAAHFVNFRQSHLARTRGSGGGA
jgi:hypothetical protein